MGIQLNEGLTFEGILKKVKEYIDASITESEFNEWLDTLNIRASIGMVEKSTLLFSYMVEKNYSDADSNEMLICELYKWIFFNLYIQSYLGIEVPLDDKTYINYDLLEPILGPRIEQVALRDINVFKEMLKDSLNFYNLKEIMQVFGDIDMDSLKEAVESNKELIDEFESSRSVIQDLKELYGMTNEATAGFVQDIRNSVVEDIKRKSREEYQNNKELIETTINREIEGKPINNNQKKKRGRPKKNS